MRNELFNQIINCPLIFVEGKGGVGKTLISQSIAHLLASRDKKTLWVTFEDPQLEKNLQEEIQKNLWILNCEAGTAFEEYAALKLKFPKLAKIFVGNKLIRYLAQASPGIHEIVLLGKVWHERNHFDHVVIDMPSTGYGIAMFKSTFNFSKLFRGGPLQKDADHMLQAFSNPTLTSHLIVALPEEMPLQEALELKEYLLQFFPQNPSFFLVNKKFPRFDQNPEGLLEHSSENPLARSAFDFLYHRSLLEEKNLELWHKHQISPVEIPYFTSSDLKHSGAFEKNTSPLLPLVHTVHDYMEKTLL